MAGQETITSISVVVRAEAFPAAIISPQGGGGEVTVKGGEGSDTILFGNYTAGGKKGTNEGGTVVVDAGTGDDDVSFGKSTALGEQEDAVGGEVEVYLGTGADSLSFGDQLANATGNASAGKVKIDLGDDTDADTLTFLGSVGDAKFSGVVTVQNFKDEDKIIIEAHDEITDLSLAVHADGVLVTRISGTFIDFVIEGTTDPDA